MLDTVAPIPQPRLLVLNGASSHLLASCHICIWPHTLDHLVLPRSGEHLGDVRKEAVDLVWIPDDYAGVSEWKGNGDSSAVRGAIN